MAGYTVGKWITESTPRTSNGLDELVKTKDSYIAWVYRKEDAELIRAALEMYETLKEIASIHKNTEYDEIDRDMYVSDLIDGRVEDLINKIDSVSICDGGDIND